MMRVQILRCDVNVFTPTRETKMAKVQTKMEQINLAVKLKKQVLDHIRYMYITQQGQWYNGNVYWCKGYPLLDGAENYNGIMGQNCGFCGDTLYSQFIPKQYWCKCIQTKRMSQILQIEDDVVDISFDLDSYNFQTLA